VNLLVTNRRNAQAYAIIQALRPHADKIVVTIVWGDPAVSAPLACGELAAGGRALLCPLRRGGLAGGEHREGEHGAGGGHIQAVLRICEVEKIDTIFPSWDPKVYVFSKNKARFEKLGARAKREGRRLIQFPHLLT